MVLTGYGNIKCCFIGNFGMIQVKDCIILEDSSNRRMRSLSFWPRQEIAIFKMFQLRNEQELNCFALYSNLYIYIYYIDKWNWMHYKIIIKEQSYFAFN